MFYCDADDEATTLVKKVLGYSVHKPYVENLPESERPSVITGENADKMVGIWQSVEVSGVHNCKAMTRLTCQLFSARRCI